MAFVAQYGSPVPNTPAQIALLEDGARITGWADLPRKSFPAYLAHFVGMFISDWMPTLATRNAFHYVMLAVPIAALGCALAGFFVSLHRLSKRRETALDVLVICGVLTIVTTFAIHIAIQLSAPRRDRLPDGGLSAILSATRRDYPARGHFDLAAVERPRIRAALTGFLIAGPILFRLLAAPFE